MEPAVPASENVGIEWRREAEGIVRRSPHNAKCHRRTPPQQTRLPLAVRAQVEMPRASIDTSRSARVSRTGRRFAAARVSTRSCPYWFEPQQYASPLAIAHV